MALVIDGSSPAPNATTARTNTCAAFTPPDSPLLLASWAGNTGGSDPPAPAISSSPAQSWTRAAWDHLNSGSPGTLGQAAMFWASVTGTPGSSTVSVVNGQTVNQFSSELVLYVITGHDPVAPVGVAGGGRQDLTGTTITQSYTGSIDGGQGFMAICDYNANAVTSVAAASGCTVLDKGVIAGEISYIIVQRTLPDGVLGGTTTLGVTGVSSSFTGHWAYAEVISLEAAAARRQVVLDGSNASNW